MKFKSICFLSALLLGVGVISLTPSSKEELIEVKAAGYTPDVTYTNNDKDTYYNNLSNIEVGSTFLTSLQKLNSSKRHKTMGYGTMGTSASNSCYVYTDYDTTVGTVKTDKNGQPYGDTISSFYTYTPATGWNREHVWPNSLGGGSVDGDVHMTRPTISSENSSRGNSFYVEGKNSSSGGWDPVAAGYSEASRGEAARIILYCMVANNALKLVADNSGGSNTMGNLETLLKWNINHQVTERERNRNEGAEYLQGNRNPFVDHPEYACRIWGSTNSTTQSLCNGAIYPDDSTTIAIRLDDGSSNVKDLENTRQLEMNIGESANFFAAVDDEQSADVTWSLSNEEVATKSSFARSGYSNGVTINATKRGKTNLTASYTYTDNGQSRTISFTTTISIKDSSGSLGEGTLVIDANIDGLENTEKVVTLNYDGIELKANAKAYNGDKVWFTANRGYVYNTMSLGRIKKITIAYGTGGSASAYQVINVGNKMINGFKESSDENGTTITTSQGGSSNFFAPDGDFGFFNISVKSKNLQATSISVDYEEVVTPDTPVLQSISTSGQTTSYKVNDTFSYDGTLTAIYSSGDPKTVTPTSVSSPDMTTAGEKEVTLSYTEGGVTVTTKYTITVSEDTPTPPGPTPDPDTTPSQPETKKGCGGDIATSSIILSSIALVSLVLVSITYLKRKKSK